MVGDHEYAVLLQFAVEPKKKSLKALRWARLSVSQENNHHDHMNPEEGP